MNNALPTLKEHINLQARGDYNKILAKLSVSIDRSLHAIDTYLTGKVAVPEKMREAINSHFKTEFDYDRAHEEFLKRQMQDVKKAKAKRNTQTAHA